MVSNAEKVKDTDGASSVVLCRLASLSACPCEDAVLGTGPDGPLSSVRVIAKAVTDV